MTRSLFSLRHVALLILLFSAVEPAVALPPAKAALMLQAARELKGVPYTFGGRLREGEGIDCLGLIYFAAERVGPCGWKSFSVNPTTLVKRKELGVPVPGLSPAAVDAFDAGALQPGDVVFLLSPSKNPAEPSIASIDGGAMWVWHTGLATEDGRFIEADIPTVIEPDLNEYLHLYGYAGIYVLRMKDGPKPATCRKHAPMQRPDAGVN